MRLRFYGLRIFDWRKDRKYRKRHYCYHVRPDHLSDAL